MARIYLVEDHDDMRLILKKMIVKRLTGIEFVGESTTAEQALEEIPRLHPDLVLVDISLPGMDGIELIRRLKPRCKSLYMLVVTGHDVERYKQAAMEAGADGIVSKSDVEQLLEAIRELLAKHKADGWG